MEIEMILVDKLIKPIAMAIKDKYKEKMSKSANEKFSEIAGDS